MNETPIYTEYHPRWYRRRVSTYWWLERSSYLLFILRELSSAFIAWFVVFTLLGIRAVKLGPDSYQAYLNWAASPFLIIVNLVTLFFVVLHAATWFNLAPKAMVVHWRGRKVPGEWIAYANYGAWAVASLVIALILLI
ncbi:MAG: hypothetical protein L0215_10500 [Gemmataceae bacterium]|nr:hypothetical protein [Gemmataceae bacterium]